MLRKWASFDKATTDAEFRTIPDRDVRDLFRAMKRYAEGLEGGYTVRNYGGDLYMIKATNKTSGRCLFFTFDSHEPTLAVALLGYKKETNDAPADLIQTARQRRGQYLDNRREE